MPHLSIGDSGEKGRGVFAEKDFETGDVLEECPVIALNQFDTKLLCCTILDRYYFWWGESEDEGRSAILGGYGSFYNHSFQPNAAYTPVLEHQTFIFTALRKIFAGEEIVINYNRDPASQKPLDTCYGIPPSDIV